MFGADLPDCCQAGREARYGGRWTQPCIGFGTNALGFDNGVVVLFCDHHLAELVDAGLVTHQNMDPDAWSLWTGVPVEVREDGA